MYKIFKMKFSTEHDLIQAYRWGKEVSTKVGLNDQDKARLAAAILKVARHALNHGQEGYVEFFISHGIPQSLVVHIGGIKVGMPELANLVGEESKQVYSAAGLVDDFAVKATPEGDTIVILKKHRPADSILTKRCCREIADMLVQYPPKDLMEEIHRQNQELLQAMDELQQVQEELHEMSKELEETNRGVIALTAEIEDKNENLRVLSLYDKLTGLYNRAYFEEEMHRLDGGRKYPISIIIIDVDNLKLVNDSLGHKAGDELLINCATALHKTTRNEDVLARIGGDEFALILPTTEAVKAAKIVERIKRAVEEVERTSAKLRVSVGCSTAIEPTIPLVDIFKEADTNMYRDKLSDTSNSRGTIINTLMSTLAERDYITSGHAERLLDMAKAMGEKIKMPLDKINDLMLLSHVHDLGKIGVSDRVLFKPGKLTSEEWKVMRQHPEIGHRIAKTSADLKHIADLILYHHERWDGKGYPLGLKEKEIPKICRILSIIDAFDVMTNDRPYKKGISVEEAIVEIKECAGTQFDPELVEEFISLIKEDYFARKKTGNVYEQKVKRNAIANGERKKGDDYYKNKNSIES